MKPINGMTRECQHVNEKWHRCGRLAYRAVTIRIGDKMQYSYRCKGHTESASAGQHWSQLGFVNLTQVDDDEFELGYKP